MLSYLYLYNNTSSCHDPYRNIAIEEYLMRHVPEDAVTLFLWQNERTVVIGRNQNAWRECQVEKLSADGGHLARRLSGGGAVYHNLGNLNFTFCAPKALYDVKKQVSVIGEAAKSFGLSVEMTGRNDLYCGGWKFSGNAFYKSGGRCYHHGTILISEDMKNMVKYLDTAGSKLHAKSVPSLHARVVNLADLNSSVTVTAFAEALEKAFAKVYGLPVKRLSAAELDAKEIEDREAFFASDDWRLGHQLPFTDSWEEKFPWGTLRLYVTVEQGRIAEASIDSDGLASDLLAGIPQALKGIPYEKEAMKRAIRAIPAEEKEERDVLFDVGNLVTSD